LGKAERNGNLRCGELTAPQRLDKGFAMSDLIIDADRRVLIAALPHGKVATA
jgi:hypothetical protein